MGVYVCGKTSFAAAQSIKFGISFTTKVDLHPQSGFDKVTHGVALITEASQLMQTDGSLEFGCSAFKKTCRNLTRTMVSKPARLARLSARSDLVFKPTAARGSLPFNQFDHKPV